MLRLRERLRSLRQDLKTEFDEALAERYTPKQVASSFALGVFITALPTFGIGVLVFFVLLWLFAGISRLALFASVLVLNPVVKWGVYGASFWLGSTLLGPPEGITVNEISLEVGPQVASRLLLGNLIFAVIFTAVAYVVAYRLTAAYRRRRGGIGTLETLLE